MNGSRWIAGMVALSAVMALSACSDTRKAILHSKQAPDEFSVYSRAPLTIPPNFSLRPPEPGEPRPGGKNPTGRAYTAMTGTAPPAGQARDGDVTALANAFRGTPGERALLGQAKALKTDPKIRQEVNQETSILAQKSLSVTEKLLYPKDVQTYGSAVDPVKEASRLKENQALGKPLNEGEVPTIRRKKRGLLEGLFN